MSKRRASAEKAAETRARASERGSGADKAAAPSPAEGTPVGSSEVRLDIPQAGFEGPLDLLLHLIQQHELDILNIPVGFVTEKFLAYIKLMQTLSIDVASEYLVMAATLAHIKSKMLLPSVPGGQDDDGLPGEEEEDPRAELVRRLLEYQKYKAAAADLSERGTLGKDVFGRGATEVAPEGPAPFASTGVFSLLDAFEQVLKRANIKIDHEVVFDRISITDRIVELTDKLSGRKRMAFDELLLDPGQTRTLTRFDIVITFLALLEMARLRMVRVHQTDSLAPIHIELTLEAAAEGEEDSADTAPRPRRTEKREDAEPVAPASEDEPLEDEELGDESFGDLTFGDESSENEASTDDVVTPPDDASQGEET